MIFVLAAWLPFPGRGAEVYINEIMAANQSIAPLPNAPDYFPDYVELYNASGRDIDLGAEQWSLSTKRDPSTGVIPGTTFDPSAFYFFKAGTIIPADSYLLVFFDNETNFPGIHTTFTYNSTNTETFTLSQNGDYVKIYKSLGFILEDSVTFGFQIPDYSIGRIPDATSSPPGNFTLNLPTPCGSPGGSNACLPNIAAAFIPAPTGRGTNNTTASGANTLKLNEWLAFSTSNGGTRTNSDWFEIYNPDTNIVSLDGLIFTDKDQETFLFENQAAPNSYIAPFGFVQYFADGDGDDPDAVNFSLSSTSGDEIYIFANDQTAIIDQVVMAAFPVANISRGRLPDGDDYITPNTSPLTSLSPEASNFSTIPEVAINEVLTHTDPPLEDAIELVNLTDSTQNIGNWWLSNNRNDPMKFRIPAGTTIAPHSYIVFYEYQFSDTNYPGTRKGFTLNSANGDECYLFRGSVRSGQFFLTGHRRGIDFGAGENGVSFGRYITSQNDIDIVAMSDLSLGTSVRAGDPVGYQGIFRTGTGAANPTPKIGPLVINEIQYNPPRVPVLGGQVDDSTNEFVEIFNVTDNTVLLYDPIVYRDQNGIRLPPGTIYADGRTNTWRLRDGVSFEFPPNVSLGAGRFLLVVNFDPSDAELLHAFTNKYSMGGVPAQTQIFGPYRGKLNNGGATVELRRPDAPQGPQHPDFRLVPYIVVDRIKYSDSAPWPVNFVHPVTMAIIRGPDGGGDSLQRISSYEYGNDVINWRAATPTPGRFNTPSGVEPPSISRHPLGTNTTAGKSWTFAVTARGGQLRYQWFLDEFPIAGATNATLPLLNLATNQSGAYNVMVSNPAGTNVSNTAQLIVNPPPNDSIRPTINITTPSYASTTNEFIQYVGGTASDKGSGIKSVHYSINGGPFIAATGSVTYAIWGTPVPVNLSPGTNTVSAYCVDQADNLSLTNTRSYFRSLRPPLELSIVGSGSVKGATNGQPLELGRNFTLTATPATGFVFSNWVLTTNHELAHRSASPTLTYPMASNLAVKAEFVPNPFAAAAGKFNGLFYETNTDRGVLHGSSGFFTLTLSGSGSYSASILSGGFKLSASGQLDLDGKATNTIPRKGTNDLTVVWCVDLAGHDTVTGTVSDPIAGWSAPLNGDRAVFSKTNPCTNAGKYTFTLPGLPHDMFVPGGDSYGTVSVDSNGVATLKGYLADKTSAAQKVPISMDGQWPLYVSLYSGKGSILAWVGFTGDGFQGDLNWSKPALPTAKHYPLGFATNQNTLAGSRYAAPVGATNRVLQMTSGTLTLSGGNLPEDYTNALVLGLASKVTNGGPHKLSLTFTLSTGLFKGSLTPTNPGAKALSFAGAVLQNATNASGHHLGTNQSDRVLLEPAP